MFRVPVFRRNKKRAPNRAGSQGPRQGARNTEPGRRPRLGARSRNCCCVQEPEGSGWRFPAKQRLTLARQFGCPAIGRGRVFLQYLRQNSMVQVGTMPHVHVPSGAPKVNRLRPPRRGVAARCAPFASYVDGRMGPGISSTRPRRYGAACWRWSWPSPGHRGHHHASPAGTGEADPAGVGDAGRISGGPG